MTKVAIITRTKNRPILLPRVRASVENQTFRDFVWVLVNDAGERGEVDRQADIARTNGVDVVVVHRDKSVGMEAASNDGMKKSSSEYAVIHDDDDTWQPDFLKQTVDYLDENISNVGVVTHSIRIDEEITDNHVKITGKSSFNGQLNSIKLSDLSFHNNFPPISFLFRRSCYDAVNGFDETLPVLGDWDFNLRTLLEGDIGLIPEALANYHFRISNVKASDSYGNTVTAGIDKHIQYEAIYRNRKLRNDINTNSLGLGFVLHQAYVAGPRHQSYVSLLIQKILKKIGLFEFVKRLLS
ncbi:glycosyl transferase, family 2 [Shewanella sediminis HAW-EB3]|uniref:Glycosyl transferase, family 2 n=1 Tax=Shewanella sediminis (strain HAW-EB3) TaxID=425104 RepID=A8FXP0_SHESH|nr:glycosyltransferase [Shewanella sediminis]ABV37613.1 glycosyl transferase, family 2 [Shewanella sediminis HAW-EB3]